MTRKLVLTLVSVALVAGFFVAGWFAYFVMSDVHKGDVVKYNGMNVLLNAAPFESGDLVRVSADGQRMTRLCPLEIDADDKNTYYKHSEYVNGLTEALPNFVQLVELVKSWFSDAESATAPGHEMSSASRRVAFEGTVSRLENTNVMPNTEDDCACEMVAALMARDRVCVVTKSLIETQLITLQPGAFPGRDRVQRVTIGVNFRPAGITVGDFSQLMHCDGVNPDARLDPNPECPKSYGQSVDVRVRDLLNVIREKDLLTAMVRMP
ncbi:hypothetical protein [Ruegeria sp. HKCCD6604]|uniref:hypothetical protein n=1 Tax=Ruegeria sp. HKCCD6604 TaxID=2683000 RepID=UPI0014909689|nr:hypothetical protein [Ruegeria sp. HKCCD6604]NOC93267.1 hypothetical protein [Ruegeria sp. HKCCD6604]